MVSSGDVSGMISEDDDETEVAMLQVRQGKARSKGENGLIKTRIICLLTARNRKPSSGVVQVFTSRRMKVLFRSR